ncbi:MAG: DUF6683 family protein [Steroidobacteraceae bacterium]
MPRPSACIAFALLLLSSAPTLAQWSPSFTASLGRGYGNIALSQSVLSNTRALSSSQPAADARASTGNSAAPTGNAAAVGTATLTYIPDQTVSDRVRAQTVDALSETLPHLRSQMEESFAGNTVLKEFDHRMANKGYSSHNVADDMAELLVASWEITTGTAAQDVQIQGAHRQVRAIFLGNARLRAMTNIERQEMAERIAYQVVISSLAHREYLRSGDRVQLAGLQQAVTTMLRQQGIDLTNLRLTPQGFHR